ncbi:MAG: hypothetical protein LUO80_08215 [Methylococcaceae bacterium]|jgi:hypothetical protein|nr:hypothetical protein [Methylococcaceae bacterium]
MPNNIARDSVTRSKFQIIGLDEETGMLNVQYQNDGWIRGFERNQKIPLVDFINTLIEGRIEIHPVKQPYPTEFFTG